MQRWQPRWTRRLISFGLAVCLWFTTTGAGLAESLSDRLASYPDWQRKPTTQVSKGDLVYPDWMAGNWTLETTLVDMVAPLAPKIQTPGFESNREFLNQPIAFPIRFVSAQLPIAKSIVPTTATTGIVSDRAFNGLSIAKAYLGADMIQAVKVDPENPNRQLTILKGNRQLESTISDRAVEQREDRFITSEVFQQVFRGREQPYLNQVETTTAYSHLSDTNKPIVADQVTAIYLSPNDPDYFKAGETPVALYRYKLEFFPLQK
ncbi:hypothetical protein IQ266_12585 [filamentous cyanobacterium LEGE 11480]|uniref:DUF6816 domain-containing protein n=1 Tax=Romeriopsis navalis LEGE 11480 TaxID=2777977 RepID=A0A928VMX6_9CYAN|nr:hypothetical protein [Romeriopsis navalis]MBE9030567.1 hypothetical protein [Romeriopsis navalis LEGE 11480]